MPDTMPEIGELKLFRAEATGNRFLLWDRFDDATPEQTARAQEAFLAPRVCQQLSVDGVLTLAAPVSPPSGKSQPETPGGLSNKADLRMVLHNADGSRAQACGNGLRVLTLSWHRRNARGGPRNSDAGRNQGSAVSPGGPALVETDAGPREVWALADSDGVVRRARVSLGCPRMTSIDETLTTPAGSVLAHLADVGNPHCVVFVADLARVDFSKLGQALERHSRFPDRTNVEFVERDGEGLRLRVWERGVGETESCGSGAVAAAFVARALHGQHSLAKFSAEASAMAPTRTTAGTPERTAGRTAGRTPGRAALKTTTMDPLRVETRGGPLLVHFTADGLALLEGPAEICALDPGELSRVFSRERMTS